MRPFILLLTLYFFSCTTNKQQDTSTPKTADPNYEVALQFINAYAAHSNSSAGTSVIDWISQRTDVSAVFKTELTRILTEAEQEDPALGLGSDPILDAQDHPDQFEIDRSKGNFVTVKGTDWPEFQLTLRLTNQNGPWLVHGSGIVNIPENKRAQR